MARKVLISFLGTSDYLPVYYSREGKKVTDHPTKYIQEALASKLCKGWSDKDCIMVFRTKESNERNWINTENGPGLESTLKGMSGLKCRVNPEKEKGIDSYIIPAGFSEQETEDMFKCVFDKLDKGDEVYFDMTHAFRSIPIFASTLFNYARFLKDVKVKGVYYGAFEALGPGHAVKEWPMEKIEANPAPIVDMTNMVLLQDLTTAAASFRNSGNLSAFSDLLADRVDEGLDEAVDDIIFALGDLNLYIQTSCIDDLKSGEYMKTIRTRIDDFCESGFTTNPQRKLIGEIQSELNRYGFVPKDEYANVESAIKWAIDHNMIQQAYTMAKEYIISRVYDLIKEDGMHEALLAEVKKDNPKLKPKNQTFEIRRAVGDIIKSIFKINNGYYMINKFSKWHNSPTAKKLIRKHQCVGDLEKPYLEISESRNLLSHGGTTSEDVKDFNTYKEEFNECWDRCLKALRALE